MRLNSDIVITIAGYPLVLVPYEELHVQCYHTWMQSPELLALTASEPLSLEEEFQNMTSWREDDSKMTFIILDRSLGENFMVGDVNLYLQPDTEEGKKVAEVEVMIAEPAARRKGLAKTALRIMMAFAVEHLQTDIFVAKVLDHNKASIALFTDALDFEEERKVPVFGEIHYKREVDSKVAQELQKVLEQLVIKPFANSVYARPPCNTK